MHMYQKGETEKTASNQTKTKTRYGTTTENTKFILLSFFILFEFG